MQDEIWKERGQDLKDIGELMILSLEIMTHPILYVALNSAQTTSCYMFDVATAILTVLIKGRSCEAYNISNPDSVISIKDMAELCAKYGGVSLNFEMPSIQEKKAFNPMLNSSLDSSKLQNLGWRGLFNADTGISHTIDIIRESEKGDISKTKA